MAWYDEQTAMAIRRYSGHKDMEHDLKKAGEKGWKVTSTSTYTRRPLWRLIIPVWWLFGTSGYTVTYTRDTNHYMQQPATEDR